jgi:hypothetical protein
MVQTITNEFLTHLGTTHDKNNRKKKTPEDTHDVLKVSSFTPQFSIPTSYNHDKGELSLVGIGALASTSSRSSPAGGHRQAVISNTVQLKNGVYLKRMSV